MNFLQLKLTIFIKKIAEFRDKQSVYINSRLYMRKME